MDYIVGVIVFGLDALAFGASYRLYLKNRGTLDAIKRMLQEGSLVTTSGELTDDGRGFSMPPPTDGTPYFLTPLPLDSLIRKDDEDQSLCRTFTISMGGIGVFLACLIAWKLWNKEEGTKMLTPGQLQGASKGKPGI